MSTIVRSVWVDNDKTVKHKTINSEFKKKKKKKTYVPAFSLRSGGKKRRMG